MRSGSRNFSESKTINSYVNLQKSPFYVIVLRLNSSNICSRNIYAANPKVSLKCKVEI